MISNSKPEYKYIFGPVPSRRIGLSLGVDLMPHKTCSLDCVYCECGKTTNLTITPEEFILVDHIRQELETFLAPRPRLDYITFSGSGEPTLHSGIGEIIKFLKTDYPEYPIAVLTNSTLFYSSEIRRSLLDADLVIASFDAASDNFFKAINRPHPELNLKTMVAGISALKNEFSNKFWMEIFIVPGFNDKTNEIKKIQNVINKIKPQQVHLNSLDRPGTEDWVKPASKQVLKSIHACMHNVKMVNNIISSASVDNSSIDFLDFILTTLKRRPCTVKDISKITGAHLNKINQHLDILMKNREVIKKKMPRGIFFFRNPG